MQYCAYSCLFKAFAMRISMLVAGAGTPVSVMAIAFVFKSPSQDRESLDPESLDPESLDRVPGPTASPWTEPLWIFVFGCFIFIFTSTPDRVPATSSHLPRKR